MTNMYRTQGGTSKMLGMPTKAQEENAIQHSRDMMNRGSLFHQTLPMASVVGCNMWITGENIAMTWKSIIGNNDYATACMELWRNSPPHYENILNPMPDTVAYGYAVNANGQIWCTQTFGTYIATPMKGGSCSIVTNPSPTTRAPTSRPPTRPPPNPRSPRQPTPAQPIWRYGYQFNEKRSGYRLRNGWVVPHGDIGTHLWGYNSIRIRVRVGCLKGPCKAKVSMNGKSRGVFKLSKKKSRVLLKRIPKNNWKNHVRVTNMGKNPIVVYRVVLARK